MQVLVVEDEIKVSAFIKKGLQEENWIVTTACDGIEALSALEDTEFDVIVLDIMMPRLDGLSFLQRIRERGSRVPVLLLTAKDSIPDRVKGLKTGADDYLVKPFAFEELLARLYALVRRNSREYSESLQINGLVINIESHVVSRDNKKINLSPLEFRLLELLARNKGKTLSREAIEDYIWGRNTDFDTNVVDVYINFLRKKIDKPFGKNLIQTVRGFGYKLGSGDEN
ncbi:response regulator transcription factor [candidate division KSB1 bacterium]|nr:response regulator transcription factor [candidate division KSB1 bacterium]